jgi:hypothetical protein
MKMYDVDYKIKGRVLHNCPLAIWVDGWLLPCGTIPAKVFDARDCLPAVLSGPTLVMLPTGEVATGVGSYTLVTNRVTLTVKQTSTKRFLKVLTEVLHD